MTTESRPAGSPVDWRPRIPGFCTACREKPVDACPTCHFPLIEGWRGFDVTTVAMNGARSTGKSVYIGVSVHQMATLMAKHKTTIEPVNTQTRDTYKQYYEDPLFEELGLLPPTPRAENASPASRPPMIFSLGVIRGVRRILVIRDVAGEEMENVADNAPNLAFLRHANGLLFMFDPLAIPAIRDKLKDLVPHQNVGGNPLAVLGNLRRILGAATPRVAVIVSKFDALQALKDVNDVELKRIMSNPGAAFMRDPSLDGAGYDEADGELLSLEIESLLIKLGADDFVLSLGTAQGGKPIPHRFFAVSVLGESPDGDKLSRRGIFPYRIVDPLKWVLNSRGIL